MPRFAGVDIPVSYTHLLELRRQAGKEVARDEYDRSYC